MQIASRVDGRSVGAAMGVDENPSDLDAPVGEWAGGGAELACEAAEAARRAQPAWAAAGPMARSEVLDRAGQALFDRADDLGRRLSSEEGKTLAEGRAEVVRAGQILKYFAGEALRMTGDWLESTRPGVEVEVRREPVGVVAAVTPWNFPIAIPAWKLAPALAFGNAVVLKPAEATPASAAALVDALTDAGAPAGVVNLVLGPGREVGPALVESRAVDAVTFTGSVPTGRNLARDCAGRGKRVQCEMGGKNPLVVLADADLEVAVNAALNGAFFSTGQRCTASSRLIVEDAIHDRFVQALTGAMAALKVGHALDPQTQIGPVVSEAQLEQDLAAIRRAAEDGGRVVGGETPRLETRGWFLRPALVTDTEPGMWINREEVFGPVASVVRVRDYDHALEIANDTEFGLSAGICTRDLARSRHFLRHVQAGMAMVNLPTAGVDPHVPFGGRKASSFGPREQGAYARDFFTQIKTAYVA